MHKNLIGEAVEYKEVHENVVSKTNKDISLTQVKDIGKNELDITWKQTTLVTPADGKLEWFLTCLLEGADFKESVAKYRRKCQRLPKEKLIFIDGTGMKAGARSTHGLAPKGKKAKVKSDKPEKYQPRVDMWGAISYNTPLDFGENLRRPQRGRCERV